MHMSLAYSKKINNQGHSSCAASSLFAIISRSNDERACWLGNPCLSWERWGRLSSLPLAPICRCGNRLWEYALSSITLRSYLLGSPSIALDTQRMDRISPYSCGSCWSWALLCGSCLLLGTFRRFLGKRLIFQRRNLIYSFKKNYPSLLSLMCQSLPLYFYPYPAMSNQVSANLSEQSQF